MRTLWLGGGMVGDRDEEEEEEAEKGDVENDADVIEEEEDK